MSRYWLTCAAVALLGIGVLLPSHAQIVDPANDLLPTFQGTPGGDVDVISADGVLNGNNFIFTATMNAPLFTTPNSLYVWGVNRGKGTAGFSTIAPGVLFDAVIVASLNATNQTFTLRSNGTNLPTSDVQINGATITITVPTSTLPSTGFDLSQYTWNLWPRNTTGNPQGIAAISDFAPNNSNVTVRAVPEPSAFALAGCAGISLLHFARRRRRK